MVGSSGGRDGVILAVVRPLCSPVVYRDTHLTECKRCRARLGVRMARKCITRYRRRSTVYVESKYLGLMTYLFTLNLRPL